MQIYLKLYLLELLESGSRMRGKAGSLDALTAEKNWQNKRPENFAIF